MFSLGFRQSVALVLALVGLSTIPQTASANSWYTYYDDYFYTLSTCNSQGAWLVANVNGIRDYHCYRSAGDSKFSMDVYDIFAK